MSWKEKINIQFEIRTGDGNTYKPLLAQGNSVSVDPMATAFEFPGIDGSLVKRKSTSGRSFPLVFVFQGINHLDEADNFITSSQNKRPWTVIHPKYGEITAQPIAIKRDDSSLGISSFEVEIRETIIQSYPNTERSKAENIRTLSNNALNASELAFGIAVKSASTENKAVMSDSIDSTYDQFSLSVKDVDEKNKLVNAYLKAKNAIDSLGIGSVQSFILSPSASTSNVRSRVELLSKAFGQMNNVSTFSLKEYFQAVGASILAGMCFASISPNKNDYLKRKDVGEVAKLINDNYAFYINKLGEIQDSDLSVSETFNPDPDVLAAIQSMINETIANLNEIIFGALVENVYLVPYPTNLILLTHLLIGRVTDQNIQELIAVNNFDRDEYLNVKKGREITYYS